MSFFLLFAHVCMHTSLVPSCVRIYVCMHACIVYMYVCIHKHHVSRLFLVELYKQATCLRLRLEHGFIMMFSDTGTNCVCVCVYIYIYIYIYIYMHTYTYMNTVLLWCARIQEQIFCRISNSDTRCWNRFSNSDTNFLAHSRLAHKTLVSNMLICVRDIHILYFG